MMVVVMVVVGKRRTVQGAAGSDCGDQATPARSDRRQTAIRIDICHNRMLGRGWYRDNYVNLPIYCVMVIVNGPHY